MELNSARSSVLRTARSIKIHFCECFSWTVQRADCFITSAVLVSLWFDCAFLPFRFSNMKSTWVAVLKHGRWRRDFGPVKKSPYFGAYSMKFSRLQEIISCKSPVRVIIAFLRKSSHDLRQIYVVYFCIISKGFVRYLLISVFLSSFIVSFDCSLFDLIFDASFEKCSLPFGDPVILKSHALG